MEWKPYGHRGRAGRVGEVLTEGTARCVYCEGTGVVPNTRSSTCQICSGEGTILIDGPAVRCPFCNGRGTSRPASRATCLVCKGKGVVPVVEPVEVCPGCQGSGKELGDKLPCRTCRGKGVITTGEPNLEGEPFGLKKQEANPGFAGRGGARELARKQMAEEVAIVRVRKGQDPRLEASQPAAQAWRRKGADNGFERRLKEREKIHQEFEKWRKGTEQAGSPSPGQGTPLKSTKAGVEIEDRSQDLGIAGWLEQGLGQWAQRNEPESKKIRTRPNSAALAMMIRRAVARETALALGKPLPGPHAFALEQAAAEWQRRQEEKQRLAHREIAMLQKLVQLMDKDNLFDASNKDGEWAIGRVGCLVEKVPQDGWAVVVIMLDKNRFVLRRGWGDLLGVYLAELDDRLNLKDHFRLSPKELDELEEHIGIN